MNTNAHLTNREKEIAEFTSYGFSQKEIAECLEIASRTVANTTSNIFQKLEINSATQLSAWFFLKNKHNVSFERHNELRKVFELKRNTGRRKRRKDNLNCFA